MFETGLNGVCRCMELKRKDSWKKWRPIDSNAINARKYFETEENKEKDDLGNTSMGAKMNGVNMSIWNSTSTGT